MVPRSGGAGQASTQAAAVRAREVPQTQMPQPRPDPNPMARPAPDGPQPAGVQIAVGKGARTPAALGPSMCPTGPAASAPPQGESLTVATRAAVERDRCPRAARPPDVLCQPAALSVCSPTRSAAHLRATRPPVNTQPSRSPFRRFRRPPPDGPPDHPVELPKCQRDTRASKCPAEKGGVGQLQGGDQPT